jgi:pantoate--beta-alanine ligase
MVATTTTILETREQLGPVRQHGRSIGLVPTMGALHEGHLALIRAARSRCDFVIVSIFVNPTQFSPGEDFAEYPRTLEADLAACEAAGVDLVFAPGVEEMYRDDARSTVTVSDLTTPLCGANRPGHFVGVTTVVAKLFNIVLPDRAFFGEKDYQQLQVIRRMTRDLDWPIEIVACPTCREPDGLAVSSRNAYLSPAERTQATCLYAAMRDAAAAVATGERNARKLQNAMRERILAAGPARIDYVSIVNPDTLADVAVIDRPVRICVAVHIGPCRLIDNLAVDAEGVSR